MHTFAEAPEVQMHACASPVGIDTIQDVLPETEGFRSEFQANEFYRRSAKKGVQYLNRS